MNERIGVLICGCGPEIEGRLDIEEVAKEAANCEDVVVSRTSGLLCSPEGKEFIKKLIRDNSLTRIVVAGCSPKEHEHTFRKVLEEGGLNPFLLQVVNIREQCAWVVNDHDSATKKAKRLVRAAVGRVRNHQELTQDTMEVNADILVLGSGVTGMSAALSLASAERTVYLVEKSPVIGGKVALYDEVFPAMDCGSCILEPMMDSVLHNDHVELFTCSTLREVLGYYGNFHVAIQKQARYVDADACIGCEACFEACPVEVPNEYNLLLDTRHAVYIPYQGALPNVAVIDSENCLRQQGKNCGACSEACSFNAIRYNDEDQTVDLKVGAIVVASGFDLPESFKTQTRSYENMPNVLTGLAFERMIHSAGPTQGRLLTGTNSSPENIILIHCSILNQGFLESCRSGLGTRLALKYATIIKERWPSVLVTNLYTELCLEEGPGKGLLENLLPKAGISFIRMDSAAQLKFKQRKETVHVSFVDSGGNRQSITGNMVIINPLPEAGQNIRTIAKILDIDVDESGCFQEIDPIASPLSATSAGIWIAGCARGFKDIQSSITEGKAAAGEILSTLIPGRTMVIDPMAAGLREELCSGCGICISTCYFKAISREESSGKITLNRLLCRGCGTCAAACPSGAIESPCFTDDQLCGEVEGLLELRENKSL
jgi:heterodisulfide reductase subunit A